MIDWSRFAYLGKGQESEFLTLTGPISTGIADKKDYGFKQGYLRMEVEFLIGCIQRPSL